MSFNVPRMLRLLRTYGVGLLQVRGALLLVATALALGGSAAVKSASGDTLVHAPFGTMPDGKAVELYTLRNAHGMEVRIATYGGTVTSLTAPDRAGHYADVVLGTTILPGISKAARTSARWSVATPTASRTAPLRSMASATPSPAMTATTPCTAAPWGSTRCCGAWSRPG